MHATVVAIQTQELAPAHKGRTGLHGQGEMGVFFQVRKYKSKTQEAMKKRLVFGRLMSLSVTYFKNQPWLLQKSGETGCAAQSEIHILIAQLFHPFIALIFLLYRGSRPLLILEL